MTIYYAHIDNNNILQGWYNKDIHKVIPTPNVEVSAEQWQVAIDNSHNKINNDGTTEYIDNRTSEQKENSERKYRDSLLKNEVDPIVTNPLRWDSLSSNDQTLIINYRQLLLDIPQQENFPEEIVWPVTPAILI